MERLPPGHPSSPYNDDLTAKPPVFRLKDLELPLHGNEHGPNGAAANHEHGPPGEMRATAAEAASSNGAGGRNTAVGRLGTASGLGGLAGRPGAAPGGPGGGFGGLTGGPPGTAGGSYETAGGPGDAAREPYDDPYEPAGERYEPEAEPYEPAGERYEPEAEPYEPAGERYEPASAPYEPEDAAGQPEADPHEPLDMAGQPEGEPYGPQDTAGHPEGEPYGPQDMGGEPYAPQDMAGEPGGDGNGGAAGRLPGTWLTSPAWEGAADLGRAGQGAVAATAGAPGWDTTSGWDSPAGWDGAPDSDRASRRGGTGHARSEPEPGVDTLTHAVVNAEPDGEASRPITGPDGSWEWNGRYLTPEECQVAERALGRCRIAEGRNVFGGYGHSGLTPAMRRIDAQLGQGHLLPDTERRALKPPDSFRQKLADLILRHPDKSAEELALEVHDGIRYTFIFEPQHYAEATLQAHSRLKGNGFDLEVRRNCWQGPAYKGVNSRWRDPAHDLVFEVQFHTAASWELAARAHPLYEAIRDPATPAAERERLRSIYARMSAAVPVPPGCTAIPEFRKEGV